MKITYLRFMAINQCSVSISHLFIRFIFILSTQVGWRFELSKSGIGKCGVCTVHNIKSGSISSYIFFLNRKKNLLQICTIYHLWTRQACGPATQIHLMNKTSANSNIGFIQWSVAQWPRNFSLCRRRRRF